MLFLKFAVAYINVISIQITILNNIIAEKYKFEVYIQVWYKEYILIVSFNIQFFKYLRLATIV